MTWSHRFLRASLAGLLAAGVSLAPARARAEPTPADRETARSLMDRGYERLKQGDASGALADFKGADALVGVTSTGLAVGLALEKLGRLVEARDKLLEVTRLPVKPGESAQLRDSRTQAEKLQQAIGARIPSLKVDVTGLPAGVAAAVTLDGSALPPAALGLPRRVDPGAHRVEGTASGFVASAIEVTLAEREERALTLSFALAAPTTSTPSKAPKNTAGTIVRSPPLSQPSAFSPLFWTGVGLAGAGVIAGSITGAMSLSGAAEVEEACPGLVCPDERLRPTADRALLLAHVSTGSFALAGVGAALAVVGLVLPRSPAAHASVHLEPIVGFGVVGLRGAF